MTVSREYRDYVLDQLGRLVPVQARAMFGGVGLYSEGHFFGILHDDRIYLKVDEASRGEFEAFGGQPFRPRGPATTPMQYHELPGDLLEDHVHLGRWIEEALRAARAGGGAKGGGTK